MHIKIKIRWTDSDDQELFHESFNLPAPTSNWTYATVDKGTFKAMADDLFEAFGQHTVTFDFE
jgi:hypothetical protein